MPEVLEVLEVLEMTQEEQLSSDMLVKESELPVHDLPAKTTRKKNFMNLIKSKKKKLKGTEIEKFRSPGAEVRDVTLLEIRTNQKPKNTLKIVTKMAGKGTPNLKIKSTAKKNVKSGGKKLKNQPDIRGWTQTISELENKNCETQNRGKEFLFLTTLHCTTFNIYRFLTL